MTDLKKKWYVVRAISGQEAKVKLYIEKEIQHLGMQDFVSQILVPTEKVYQVRNGKKITKERNYFPGYVMIEASLVGEVINLSPITKNKFIVPASSMVLWLFESVQMICWNTCSIASFVG